jgi:hypothetical protein
VEVVEALGRAPHFLIGTSGSPKENPAGEGPPAPGPELLGVTIDAETWVDRGEPGDPRGSYIYAAAAAAEAKGSISMFTYSVMSNAVRNEGLEALMRAEYWSHARRFFDQIALSCEPVIVNLEPGLWDDSRIRSAPSPKMVEAGRLDSACRWLEKADPANGIPLSNLAGFGRCLLHLAHIHAPKALIAYQTSYGGRQDRDYWRWIGGLDADLLVVGAMSGVEECSALGYTGCDASSGVHAPWGEAEFQNRIAWAKQLGQTLENKPLLWWVPLRAPSGWPSPGAGDSHVQYFLERRHSLVTAGGLGAVFVSRAGAQAEADEASFREAVKQYASSPEPLR